MLSYSRFNIISANIVDFVLNCKTIMDNYTDARLLPKY